jgi:hypothetical protein
MFFTITDSERCRCVKPGKSIICAVQGKWMGKFMELDRKLQREVLLALQDEYPDSLLVSVLPGYTNDRNFMGNLFYLQEHGLIEGGDIREPGQCRSMVDVQITKSGLDFLANDGGISAILGSFMLRIPCNEIVEAVEMSFREEEIDEDVRANILDSISKLDSEAMKELVTLMLENSARDKIDFLSNYLLGE